MKGRDRNDDPRARGAGRFVGAVFGCVFAGIGPPVLVIGRRESAKLPANT